MRASLLLKIGKLWTLGNMPVGENEIMSMIQADNAQLGANAAALSIDGACLLLGSKLSLCGCASDNSEIQAESVESGFFYEHISDVDFSVKAALARTWASCANTAVTFLSETIASEDAPPEKRDACRTWLHKIVPFLFAGLEDSIGSLAGLSSKKTAIEWAKGIDDGEVAICCLQGITTLVSNPGVFELDKKWISAIEKSLALISNSVLLPILSLDLSGGSTKIVANINTEFVTKCCSLLQKLTQNPAVAASEESVLLLSLLRPLDLLQKGSVNLEDKHSAMVIAACLTAVSGVFSKPTTPNSLVMAMVSLVLTLSSKEKTIPEVVKTAVRCLLSECLGHEAITLKEQSSIALVMARAREWDSWSVIIRVNDGVAAKSSFSIVQSVLLDASRPDEQLAAVAALKGLLQNIAPPSALVGRVVCAIGAEILAVFQAYGTLNVLKEAHSYRTTACADCMKIALIACQQLGSDALEAEMTGFLVVLFQSFIAVLRFNGLPNHPPPQPNADPAIGRMCAQAITHVARTAPVPFKSSMAGLADHERVVLEFAVRAEMSGYVNAAAQAPAKKKLSLKGFKK
jgi:hypothetical protein